MPLRQEGVTGGAKMKRIQKVKLVSERMALRLFGPSSSQTTDQSRDLDQCEKFVDPMAEGDAIDEAWTDGHGDV